MPYWYFNFTSIYNDRTCRITTIFVFRTVDTKDLPDNQKERIESADFCALEWKFKGVNVNPSVRKILEAL